MDSKEENILIAVVSFFVGLILVFYLIPTFKRHTRFPQFFLNPYFYFDLRLLFISITLFFYSYYMLRLVKSLKGRKILSIAAISFGGVSLVFSLIEFGLWIAGLIIIIFEGFLLLYWPSVIPLLAMLILGVLLIKHGWDLRKNLRIEKIEIS